MKTSEELQRLHETAGYPSFRAIERQLVLRFGDSVPSAETLRQYHNGGVKSPDTTVLGMLAWYYGVDVADISEDAARVLVLLRGDAGPGAPTSSYAAAA